MCQALFRAPYCGGEQDSVCCPGLTLVGGTGSEQMDSRSLHFTGGKCGMEMNRCSREGGLLWVWRGAWRRGLRRDTPSSPRGGQGRGLPTRLRKHPRFSAPQPPTCPSNPCAGKLGASESLATMPPPLLFFLLLFLTPVGVRPQKSQLVAAKGMTEGHRWKEPGLDTWVRAGCPWPSNLPSLSLHFLHWKIQARLKDAEDSWPPVGGVRGHWVCNPA